MSHIYKDHCSWVSLFLEKKKKVVLSLPFFAGYEPVPLVIPNLPAYPTLRPIKHNARGKA